MSQPIRLRRRTVRRWSTPDLRRAGRYEASGRTEPPTVGDHVVSVTARTADGDRIGPYEAGYDVRRGYEDGAERRIVAGQ